MHLYPAIDLKDGKCVRLKQGDFNNMSLFERSPLEQAKLFRKQGFRHLHIVDLDGALSGSGKSANQKIITDIIKSKQNCFIQLGGGIRTLQNIEDWLETGVDRVILGTSAVKDPELVRQAAKLYRKNIAVAIDARDGKVAIEGWTTKTTITAIELAKAYENCDIAAIIYTDIKRDGMLQGVNAEQTIELAEKIDIPVIASGGVRNIDDIKSLIKSPNKPIAGAVIGRALYSGDFDLDAAFNLTLNNNDNPQKSQNQKC